MFDFNSLNRCLKITQISDFIKICPVGAKLFHVDRHHETNSWFSQFCEHVRVCCQVLLYQPCRLKKKYQIGLPVSKVVPLYAMKINGEGKVCVHSFFTSALDGGDWSASYPSPFMPGTH
jgi:hypothetical protein